MPATLALRRARLALWFAATVTLASCGGGGGGGTPVASAPPPPPPPPAAGDVPLVDPAAYSVQPGASLPAAAAVEAEAVTHHTIALPGGPLAYTAHAGHLTARDPATNAAKASFFYVAYTADGAPATRPVTFFYNGGPGSATIWLHLGSFGPKRLATGAPSTATPTPFPLVDNMDTLLDTSDLVFVDAIGTGYSEAIEPNTNQTFWGVDADAAAFRDFVSRWIAANGRAASPKYLFGESYGTTRTPVLAHLLETAGLHLDGIVLQSSILDYNSNCDGAGFAVSCAGFVPSYGQTGSWYKVAPAAQADSAANADQMRSFTATSFDPAVFVWFSKRTPPAPDLAQRLQDLTGLAASQWTARLNIEPGTYRTNLLSGVLIGRYDSRMSAPANSALARDGDPSSTFISPSFAQAIGSYLSGSLAYTNVSPYVTLSNAILTWDFRHDGRSLPDVIPDLGAALALRPQMKVLSLSGYHDLATPFLQTERDLARLGALPNVTMKFYDGGHMTYLDDTARAKERQDLRTFYQGGTP